MPRKRIDPGPFIVPMPLVLVGSTVGGTANFMPAAFVGIANYEPPVIACALSPDHHTCKGIRENGTFSLNIPTPDMVVETDYCGITKGHKTDKSRVFETFTGELETAPMIEKCRLTAECRLIDTREFEVDTLYMASIVGVYVHEEVMDGKSLDWSRIEPMIFTFPDKAYWKLGEFVARAWSVGKKLR